MFILCAAIEHLSVAIIIAYFVTNCILDRGLIIAITLLIITTSGRLIRASVVISVIVCVYLIAFTHEYDDLTHAIAHMIVILINYKITWK